MTSVVCNTICWFVAQCEKADGTGIDYYVKWESLPYSEATWEVAALIERKWPTQIREFRDREESKRTPSRQTKVLKVRPKFQKVASQPEYMGGNKVVST